MTSFRKHFAIYGIASIICVIGCGKDDPPKPPASTTTATDVNIADDENKTPATDDIDSLTRLPMLGSAIEFTGTLADQYPFDSRELEGFIWIGVLSSDDDASAQLAGLSAAVEKHPWKNAIRLVGLTTKEIAAEEQQSPFAKDWLVVHLEAAAAEQWSTQFDKSSGADDAEFAKGGMLLVDGSGRVRGNDYPLTDEGTKSLSGDFQLLMHEQIAVPVSLFDLAWIDRGRKTQLEASQNWDVPHDFQFVDRRVESGITFRHKIVDDAGKSYKPCHYDHGTGIAIADVDLDGLFDVLFVNQVGGNELWRNLSGGKFENITGSAGIALADRVCVAASFGDIDNDGDPDLYITTVRGGNALFENDGTGIFRDISKSSGTAHVGHSSGSVFFDYNLDGKLDLFVTNVGQYTSSDDRLVTMEAIRGESKQEYHFYSGYQDAFGGHLKPERNERSLLFENTGNNVFKNVTEETGLIDENWTGDACPMDLNRDGWPDLYVTNMQGNDEYYENQQGKSFIRKGRDYFSKTPWGSMCCQSFDYDRDGDFDLFLSDMHSDMSLDIEPPFEKQKSNMQFPESFLRTKGQSIFGNAFYRNDGEGKFTEISDRIGSENYWPWGFSVADVNADGYEDVFIASSMNLPFRYGINSLLLNQKGERFLDAEYVLGVEPRRHRQFAVPWYGVDCDGADTEHPDCNHREGSYVVWSSLGSRSSVIFDIDMDGDLDIITSEFNARPMVLVSDLAQRSRPLNYLKIQLEGTQSNRQGFGAVVRLRAGETTLTQVYDGKSGYLSQSADMLYFGLGDVEQVDAVEIRWPSGKEQNVAGPVQINGVLHVTETAE